MDINQIKQKKEKENRIIKIIDWTLLIGMITLIIFARSEGIFIKKTTIETCKTIPINCKGDQRTCQNIMKMTNQFNQLAEQQNPFNKINSTFLKNSS